MFFKVDGEKNNNNPPQKITTGTECAKQPQVRLQMTEIQLGPQMTLTLTWPQFGALHAIPGSLAYLLITFSSSLEGCVIAGNEAVLSVNSSSKCHHNF